MALAHTGVIMLQWTVRRRVPTFVAVAASTRRWDAPDSERQAGNAGLAAVLEFYQQNKPGLVRMCLQRSGGHGADAEDLLAAAVLKVVEASGQSSKVVEDPRAWWSTVIFNLARDRWRGRAVRSDGPVPCPPDHGDALTGVDIDRLISFRRQLTQVLSSIAALPSAQSRALALRAAGYDYEEIARYLVVSEVNARKLVQLARSAVRSRVEDDRP
jgi:RNA polymerase sigma factor (sigma-70 family)